MKQEYEFLEYNRMRHIRIFLNKIQYRNYHTHGAFEFLYVLDGEGVLTVQNTEVALTPGKIVLINPYEPHEINAGQGSMLGLFLQVSRHFCKDYLHYFSNIIFPLPVSFLKPGMKSHLLSALQDRLLKTSLCYLEAKTFFESELISHVCDLFSFLTVNFPYRILDDRDRSILKKKSKRMERIAAYLNEHYTEPVRLSDLSASERLTSTYISHLFKEYYGITFQDYLNNLRFEKAVIMIRNTGLSQLDISLACGFSDPKYLTRIIKKRIGCTLTEYRKNSAYDAKFIQSFAEHELSEHQYSDKEGLILLRKYMDCKNGLKNDIL